MSEANRKTAAADEAPAESPIAAPEARQDRRHAPRRRVLKGAKAAFQDRHCSIPCMVRDISTSGARIKSTHCANIPDLFELIVELDGLEAKCEVVWRRADEMGVRFLEPPAKVPPQRLQVVDALRRNSKPSLRRSK